MPFNYYDIEDEAVAYLSPLITTAEIVSMPENQANYQRAVDKTRVTVMYGGSTYEPPRSTNETAQIEMVSVLFSLRAMNLRGAGGIHDIIRQLKKYLLGWKATNIDKLILKSIDFEERNEKTNEWFYTVSFQGKKMQVQTLEDTEYNGARLQRVDFNDRVQLPD